MKNIYRNWIKPLLSRKGFLTLGSAFLLNYNGLIADDRISIPFSGCSKQGEQKTPVPEQDKSKQKPEPTRKITHKAHIYGEPDVLLSLIGPATYPIIEVGNEGITFNYTTDNGNHIEYDADSPRRVIASLKGYLDSEDGRKIYTQFGRDSKKRNLDSILSQIPEEQKDKIVADLDEVINDGITPDEVGQIGNAYSGLWVKSVDDKTGEIEASVPILLKIDYKETKVEVEAPKEILRAEEVEPADTSWATWVTATLPEEYSKWSLGGAVRFYKDAVAPEISFSVPVCNNLNLGMYGSFGGPKNTSSSVDTLVASESQDPEGTYGLATITYDETKDLKGSVGGLISYDFNKNIGVSGYFGVGFVEIDSTRTDLSRQSRRGVVVAEDTDVTNYDPKTEHPIDIGGCLDIGLTNRLKVSAGYGFTGDDKYFKGGVKIEY